MPTVSVIIPVYNVEKYLDQCVESVVTQTYKDVEIILVNDGSKDSSGSLCGEWAKKDSRIKVIHKQNGGLADARNCGTAAATGEWILYLDSDDWYETCTHIETLVSHAKSTDSDVVCFDYRRFFEKENKFSPLLCNPQQPQPSLMYMVDNKIYTSSACLKLIKRILITENSLLFEKGVLSEDIEFAAQLLLLAKNITFCSGCCYVYRQRENSITTSVSRKHVSDLLYIIKKLSAAAEPTDEYNSFLAFQYCTVLINAHIAKADQSTFRQIFSYKHLLQYDSGSIVKLVHTVSRIVGIRLCSFILYLYFQLVLNKA